VLAEGFYGAITRARNRAAKAQYTAALRQMKFETTNKYNIKIGSNTVFICAKDAQCEYCNTANDIGY